MQNIAKLSPSTVHKDWMEPLGLWHSRNHSNHSPHIMAIIRVISMWPGPFRMFRMMIPIYIYINIFHYIPLYSHEISSRIVLIFPMMVPKYPWRLEPPRPPPWRCHRLWALFTHWTTTACGTGGSMQQNLSALPNPILNEENHDKLYDKWWTNYSRFRGTYSSLDKPICVSIT